MLNSDYRDIIESFQSEDVRFIVVGAYAMAGLGYVRGTGDIDLWVETSKENSVKIMRALEKFGAPFDDVDPCEFEKEDMIFQIGVAPVRIDIITGVSGLAFGAAYNNAVTVKFDDLPVKVLSRDDLIINKKASGRAKDLVDVEFLNKGRG